VGESSIGESAQLPRSYTRRREGRPTRRKLGSKSPRRLGEIPGQIRTAGRATRQAVAKQRTSVAAKQWTGATGVREGRIFRAVARTGKIWGRVSPRMWSGMWFGPVVTGWVWSTSRLTTCRTCAKLCHDSGGQLEQIQFLLGHALVQTTERYLGCKQNLGNSP
jgi:hypothetical protein